MANILILSFLLFNKADQALKKAFRWKRTNPNIHLHLARQQMIYAWYHATRALYYSTEKEDNASHNIQIGEAKNHFKKAIVAAFEAVLRDMINTFHYIERNSRVTIQDTVNDYLKTKNVITETEELLEKYPLNTNNNAFQEYEKYEICFNDLEKGISSLKNAQSELEKRATSEKYKKIGLLAAIIGSIAALLKFSLEFMNS